MSGDPCMRLLGVPRTSSPRHLLGLPAGELSVVEIEAALLKRSSNAQGRDKQASEVRRILRQAAKELLASLRKPAQRPRPMHGPRAPETAVFTDFDQDVLAVLIGCGGWNAQTRTRLVSLAAAYGVSVQGLHKVMTGLSDYARHGGPRLGVAEIADGPTPVQAPASETGGPDEVEQVDSEPPSRTTGSTISLAVLSGLVTVLFGVITWRLLFPPQPQPLPPAPKVVSPSRPDRPAHSDSPEHRPAVTPSQRLAQYPQLPTFQGQAITTESASAADECPRLAAEIKTLARKISIAKEPSEAVYRAWHVAIETVATGWVLVDERLLLEINGAIVETLFAASDAPSVTDRLLASLIPLTGRFEEAVEVWRGAWITGTLARIAAGRGLPPVAVERARIQLGLAGVPDVGPRTEPFRAGAGVWLDRTAAALVDVMEFHPDIYDLWEFWIAAQRRLERGDRFDEAIMAAVELILASSTDLARVGPSVNVLGRLLSLVNFESSLIVKERVLGFFAEDSGIDSRDLWVITSLLAQSDLVGWFTEDMVPAEDADWLFRRRIVDRIVDGWPDAAASKGRQTARVRGLSVDPDLATRWLALLDDLEADQPAPTDAERLEQLVTACRLNEIALRLTTGHADEARRQIEVQERERSASRGDPARPHRPTAPGPGGPGGSRPAGRPPASRSATDGEWAVAYEDAGRRVDERLELLGALQARTKAGDDLGPIDAQVFVRVVYRDNPAEVRQRARQILVETFGRAPNVSQEMLDQFPGVPATRPTSDMIRHLTGRILPAARSGSWRMDARLALVKHVLDMKGSTGRETDQQMESVRECYDSRRACLDPQWTPSATPDLAAAELAESWGRRATEAPTADPVPGDPVEIQRRHEMRLRLAQGPLQRLVAGQLAVLDQMAYLAVAAQAELREPVIGVLLDSARRRGQMSHVLEQAVEAERAMGRIWSLQIVVDEES